MAFNANDIEDGNDQYAVIRHNNEIIKELSLSENSDYQIDLNDGYIVISVKNNSIAIIDSSCKGKECVNTGYINNGIKDIICIPNRVVISVISVDKEEIDAIAY